jgi:UPF0716 family protein affecting phage T7 exclusion
MTGMLSGVILVLALAAVALLAAVLGIAAFRRAGGRVGERVAGQAGAGEPARDHPLS